MGKTGSGFLCQDEVLVGQIGLERRRYVARLTPQSKALKGAAEAVSQLTVLIEVEVFAVDGRSFHYLALHAQKRASPCKLHLAHGQLVYAAQVAGNACEQVPEPSRRPAADLAIKEELLPVGHSRPALLPTLLCQHVAFGLRRGCAVSLGMRHALVTPCDRCANCAVYTQDIALRKIVNDRRICGQRSRFGFAINRAPPERRADRRQHERWRAPPARRASERQGQWHPTGKSPNGRAGGIPIVVPAAVGLAPYYMLRDDIWRKVAKPEERRRFLCLSCVEQSLRRSLSIEDFSDFWRQKHSQGALAMVEREVDRRH